MATKNSIKEIEQEALSNLEQIVNFEIPREINTIIAQDIPVSPEIIESIIFSYISGWSNKYSKYMESFSSEIKAKINAIKDKTLKVYVQNHQLLNNLLLGPTSTKFTKDKEAYEKLLKILRCAEKEKNYDKASREVSSWLSSYGPFTKFHKFFKGKIASKISNSYIDLLTQKFDHNLAREEIKTIISSTNSLTSDEFSAKVDEWMDKYPIKDFNSPYRSEFESFTKDALNSVSYTSQRDRKAQNDLNSSTKLTSISDILSTTESQTEAIKKLDHIMATDAYDFASILAWVKTYNRIKFEPVYKEHIKLTLFRNNYRIDPNKNYTLPEVSPMPLSNEEMLNIDNIREEAVFYCFSHVLKSKSLYIKENNPSEVSENSNTSNEIISPEIIDSLEPSEFFSDCEQEKLDLIITKSKEAEKIEEIKTILSSKDGNVTRPKIH